MKLLKIINIAVFIVFISSGAAFSAIESSPHDFIAREGFENEELIVEGKSNCSYCHPTIADVGIRIWEKPPRSLNPILERSSGCYACHDGVAIVDINVDASQTVFAPTSHAMFQNRIESGVSWQEVSLDYLDGKPLECITCHNIHNDDNRPFLVEPIDELCYKCHLGRRSSGIGAKNAESNHPSGIPPIDSSGGPTPIDIQSQFKVPFPLEYPAVGGKDSKGTHWDLGGHLTFGGEGNIECYTCHSVHGDELNSPNIGLLSIDPVREVNDQFCESCHRGERADGVESTTVFPNPGATKEPRTYHPVDDDISNGEGRIVDINEPSHWPFGAADENGDRAILCSTCHDVHNGMGFTPILRTPIADTFCEECHEKNMEGHHTSGEDMDVKDYLFASSGFQWSYENQVNWENGNPKIKLEKESSTTILENNTGEFNGYGKTFGSKVESKVYCSSCHRAHNAGGGIEKKASPLLIVSHTANQLCFMCHSPENVAFNEDSGMRASHFLGDPLSNDTYGYPEKNLHEYTEKWLETGIKSKYGGDNEREIICQSCHAFDPKNLNSTEYSNVPNKAMLIARADNDTEWRLGTGKTYDLITRKKITGEIIPIDADPVKDGDYWDKYDEKQKLTVRESPDAVEAYSYLCVGCHGESPGGGGSHPMMRLDGIMKNGTTMNRNEYEPPVTYTKNFNLNCFSCHFVHTGKNEGGVYMLKEVAARDSNTDPLKIHPKVSYRELCQKCHIGY